MGFGTALEQIRQVIDIVDIANGATSLRRNGRKWTGLCPFHKEKTPSFHVDPELGLYHCFGCGAGGDAIDLYMRHSGDDFHAAIEYLAQKYSIELPRKDKRDTERHPDRTEVLDAAQKMFQRNAESSPVIQSYLQERKISAEIRKRFGIGFAVDGWSSLLNELGKNHSQDDLEAAGLLSRSETSGKVFDRFRNRLMFPIHSPNGKLVGFGGRTMGGDVAKYINTAETPLFKKGHLLYGLHLSKRLIRDSGVAVLVEGYFDALAMAACGIENVVASMGTALTPEQAKLLSRYATEVVVCYDGDSAGVTATLRAIPLLLQAGLAVRAARLSNGEDPDSFRIKAGPDALKAAVSSAKDAVLSQLEALSPYGIERDPQTQAKATRSVVEILKSIQDPVLRGGYAAKAAARLGVDKELLVRSDAAGIKPAAVLPNRHGSQVISEEESALRFVISGGQLVDPYFFQDEECRTVYSAYAFLASAGQPATPKEIFAELLERGKATEFATRLFMRAEEQDEEAAAIGLWHLQVRSARTRLREISRELALADELQDAERTASLMAERQEALKIVYGGR